MDSVVTRHDHFSTFTENDFTGNVKGTEIELGPVMVMERRMASTFFFFQDIHLSFELGVGSNGTRFCENLTPL